MAVLSFKRVRAFCEGENQTLLSFQNRTLSYETASSKIIKNENILHDNINTGFPKRFSTKHL